MGGARMMSYFDDNILKIGYGDCDTCITAIDMEFDGLFEYDWLQNDMNKRILREIDNAIEGPLGIVDLDDPTRMFKIYDISSGAKVLMLCNMSESIKIYSSVLGDNCTPILLEIAKYRDITVYLRHLLQFPEDKFIAYSLKQSRKYHDYADYCKEVRKELIP